MLVKVDPVISIVMPCYNSQKFIAASIESVIRQTWKNWELIIVDDASTDSTRDIVMNYKSNDERIKLVEHSENSGNPSGPRNNGIRKAAGRFLAFIDSDDIWMPEKLRLQYDFMTRNQCSFSFTSYSMIDVNGISLKRNVRVPEKISYDGLLKNTVIACSTVMIDREYIDRIHFPLVKHEDTAAWLSILRGGIIAFGLDELLGLYRKHSQSVSKYKFRTISWTWNIYRNTEKLGFFKSVYCFLFYSFNAVRKHYF